MNQNLFKWVFTGFLATLGGTALAQTSPYTFVNTFGNYDGQAFTMSSGLIFGQNIHLNAPNDSLTGFEFEYAVPGNSLGTDVGVNISFYNVNSSDAPVGAPFYNSGFFYNNPSGSIPAAAVGSDLIYSTDDFTGGDGPDAITLPANYLMPSQFLVTIEFTNLTTGELNLPIATNNNNGTYMTTVANDYWVNTGGIWTEYTNVVGNNVLFSFTGVPEPTVFALSGIGSLVLFGVMNLKRKR